MANIMRRGTRARPLSISICENAQKKKQVGSESEDCARALFVLLKIRAYAFYARARAGDHCSIVFAIETYTHAVRGEKVAIYIHTHMRGGFLQVVFDRARI